MLRTCPTPLLTLSAIILAHLGRALSDRLQYESQDDGSSIRCGHPKYARVPCFDDLVKHNVVVQAGRTATLRCIVFNAKMKAVTWDKKGLGPIAIGDMIFIRDERYAVNRRKSTDYSLEIHSARPSDSGIYRCQINLEKLKEKVFSLKVEEPPDSVIREPVAGPSNMDTGMTDKLFKDQGQRKASENRQPSVLISGRDVVYAGESLRLSCIGRYHRPMSADATLDWFHYGVRKRSGRQERLTISERALNSTTLNSLLRVTPVTADNSGPWVCVKRPTRSKEREYAEIKVTVVKPIYTAKAASKVNSDKQGPGNASSRLLTPSLLFLLLLACSRPLDGVL